MTEVARRSRQDSRPAAGQQRIEGLAAAGSSTALSATGRPLRGSAAGHDKHLERARQEVVQERARIGAVDLFEGGPQREGLVLERAGHAAQPAPDVLRQEGVPEETPADVDEPVQPQEADRMKPPVKFLQRRGACPEHWPDTCERRPHAGVDEDPVELHPLADMLSQLQHRRPLLGADGAHALCGRARYGHLAALVLHASARKADL
mmetsp:Transcript_30723/g.85701  ORF Transcript_30723/g.85701 Transcript_30723/m.85701 type:complete len:206 (+) Transcript_30723:222-839(+)